MPDHYEKKKGWIYSKDGKQRMKPGGKWEYVKDSKGSGSAPKDYDEDKARSSADILRKNKPSSESQAEGVEKAKPTPAPKGGGEDKDVDDPAPSGLAALAAKARKSRKNQ